MFKICNDKTYYVVQTTSEDVVVEIYTKKDGRGSGISLHEMHLDLCRAIRKLQHDGYTIMKVYPAMGDRRESIDVLSMPEFIQSAKCPDNDVEEAVVLSPFSIKQKPENRWPESVAGHRKRCRRHHHPN